MATTTISGLPPGTTTASSDVLPFDDVGGGVTKKITVANLFGTIPVNTSITGTLAVSGAATVGGTLDSAGNFSVATNKLTVAAASGNTTIAGTLGTTGSITVAAGQAYIFGSRGFFKATADGVFSMRNNADNANASLTVGALTTGAITGVGNVGITGTITASGQITGDYLTVGASGIVQFGNRGWLKASSDGVFLTRNNADTQNGVFAANFFIADASSLYSFTGQGGLRAVADGSFSFRNAANAAYGDLRVATMRADTAFNINGTVGYTGTIDPGAVSAIVVSGGIITSAS